MTHCSNCQTLLKEGAKFCTNCGTPIKIIDKEVHNKGIVLEEKKTNNNSGKYIIVGVVIIIVALFYTGKHILLNVDNQEPLFDIEQEVEKIDGDWYDPTGVMLNDKTAIINFRSSGSFAEGKDQNSIIKISMIPVNKNQYYATVILNEVKGEFDATYYHDEGKLAFFSTLTKSSWNIKKYKD